MLNTSISLPSIIEIKVTQEDINKGRAGNSWECPIARAGLRSYGNVVIGIGSAIINTVNYLTDRNTTDFVRDFDAGCPVFPFTAKLTAIHPSMVSI